MAETGAAGGGDETTAWRPLGVARYAVVTLVAAAAVAVAAKALSVVLRPRQLKLVLTDGFVQVDKLPALPPPGNLTFRFNVLAYNPTDDDLAYSEVDVRLLDVATSPPAVVYRFRIGYRIYLESLEWVYLADKEVAVPGKEVAGRYVSRFYDGGGVSVAMRLEGALTFLPQSRERANWTRRVAYYCWPVTVGYGQTTYDDVACSQLDH